MTTFYIFTVEQFNNARCESTIRHKSIYNTEAEAMECFDNYDVELEFKSYVMIEGRRSMEDNVLVANVIPATIDEFGWVVSDPMDEIVSKQYSWAEYIED